ncbi:hypothetical protein BV22DRAFT_1030931 [Leucogyrophana mollusca]|uniref:Uncharacterized protein n=1 Tax=Leucogyrophana mollusca TaxID=85980 RepID=A0ACB8BSB3_9AGAM|nr:hypothetical protein BV22DRAFT_1030931 [Leucogyrophana mollusca]
MASFKTLVALLCLAMAVDAKCSKSPVGSGWEFTVYGETGCNSKGQHQEYYGDRRDIGIGWHTGICYNITNKIKPIKSFSFRSTEDDDYMIQIRCSLEGCDTDPIGMQISDFRPKTFQ